jgi:hypothetical protein
VPNASTPPLPPLPSSALATWASLMPSLTSLRMPACNITGPLPCALPAAAPGLASLQLHGNRLAGPLPGACWAAYATQLRLLDLSHNAINSTLPASWAPALARLQLLYLQGNQLHGSLPKGWGLLPQLKLGDLSGNQLKLGQVPKLWLWNVCAKEDAFVCLERDARGACARWAARLGGGGGGGPARWHRHLGLPGLLHLVGCWGRGGCRDRARRAPAAHPAGTCAAPASTTSWRATCAPTPRRPPRPPPPGRCGCYCWRSPSPGPGGSAASL